MSFASQRHSSHSSRRCRTLVFTGLLAGSLTALGAELTSLGVRGTALRADDLLSDVRSARDEAQHKLAINCLKQIALAMKQYHEQYGHYPPAVIYDKTGKIPHSWRVELLPFLLEQELYDAYKMNEPWDSPHNRQLLEKLPSAYLNPITREDKTHASFYAITGEGTAFANNEGTTQEQIKDGASRSLMVVETKLDIPWTKPEDIAYDAQGDALELGGNFVGGFHALMCDGTIKYLANDGLTGLVQRVELAGLSANAPSKPPAGTNPANPQLNFDLRDDARQRRSIGNLTIIAQALRLYHNQHGYFPPASSRAKNSKHAHSWRVDILPFLLLQELYDQYNMDEPWDSDNNEQVLAKMPAFFRSPDDSGNSTNSACFIITGKRAVFDGTKRLKLEQIKDGPENTLLIVEAKRDIPWTKPEDITYEPNGDLPEVGGFFDDGFHAAFCDGSVKFLDENAKKETLKHLIEFADGKPVKPPAEAAEKSKKRGPSERLKKSEKRREDRKKAREMRSQKQ